MSTGGSKGGLPVWATALSGDGDETPRAIGRAPNGELVVAAEITGTLSVGALVSAGAADVAVIRFAESGKAISAVRLGGLNPQTVHAIATDPDGSIVLAGDFSGSIAAGAKQANSNGGRDGYLAKLNSAGAVTWIRASGAPDRTRRGWRWTGEEMWLRGRYRGFRGERDDGWRRGRFSDEARGGWGAGVGEGAGQRRCSARSGRGIGGGRQPLLARGERGGLDTGAGRRSSGGPTLLVKVDKAGAPGRRRWGLWAGLAARS